MTKSDAKKDSVKEEAPAALPPVAKPKPVVAPVLESKVAATFSADVFVRLEKLRADQCAGFLLIAKKQKLKTLTRVEWTKQWDAYLARPVKGG